MQTWNKLTVFVSFMSCLKVYVEGVNDRLNLSLFCKREKLEYRRFTLVFRKESRYKNISCLHICQLYSLVQTHKNTYTSPIWQSVVVGLNDW